MTETRQIVGNSTDDLWQQVTRDLSAEEIYEYHVLLVQSGRTVELQIEIDPGGGFESGYEFTSLRSLVEVDPDYRLALHHESFIDVAGKFLGLEDVEIGYPDFDQAVVIKTNDRERTRRIFSDETIRAVFQSLEAFTLHLARHHVGGLKEKKVFLELTLEEGVVDPGALRTLYEAFCGLLNAIEAERNHAGG